MIEFKIQKIKEEILQLCTFFMNAIQENDFAYRTGYTKEKVKSELQLITKDISDNSDNLKIAFVGEYSSGKTTIINILTNKDFKTSTNVETSQPVEIPWENFTLIDTPGLGSGFEAHDEVTKEWFSKADLLIYVLTPDLFDSDAGSRFLNILELYNRQQELMLVMNMIDQEENSLDVYKEDLQSFIEPIPLNDFSPVFISAKNYLKSQEKGKDLKTQEYYLHKSFFETFLAALNKFLLSRKQKGRLTTPLTRLYTLTQIFTTRSDFEKEIELISQKIQLFAETKSNISDNELSFQYNLNSYVSETAGEIFRALDNPPKDFKTFIEEQFKTFTKNLTDEVQNLANSISDTIAHFETENILIDNSELAKEVYERIANSEVLKDIFENISGHKFKSKGDTDSNFYDEFINHAKNINAKHGGNNENFVNDLLSSKDLFQLSSQLIGKIDKKIILDIGHKISHKFKPWEAVKLASKISKAVPYINIASSIWDIGSHYFKKWKSNKKERELREFKESIKSFLNDATGLTKKMTETDLIKPISTNLSSLQKLYNSKKDDLINHSKTNKELAIQMEEKRNRCLELHDEVYQN